jgi:hypothetical protein
LANDTTPGGGAQLAFLVATIGPAYVEQHLPQLSLELGVAATSQLEAITLALNKAKRVLAQAPGPVRRQHVISQSLLRRFSEVLGPSCSSQGRC